MIVTNDMKVSTMEKSGASCRSGDRRFLTVPQFCAEHPWPSLGGLRHLIFHASANGFDSAILRVGRRVLIDEAAFFAWMDRQVSGMPRPK
jgi:hypothetical protein